MAVHGASVPCLAFLITDSATMKLTVRTNAFAVRLLALSTDRSLLAHVNSAPTLSQCRALTSSHLSVPWRHVWPPVRLLTVADLRVAFFDGIFLFNWTRRGVGRPACY